MESLGGDSGPSILFIDDDPDRQSVSIAGEYDGLAQTRLRHPEEVTDADVAQADLVVVDYWLSDWPERDDLAPPARAPLDGLGVIAALRGRLLPPPDRRMPGMPEPKPVAFALLSGKLEGASALLPRSVREHAYARGNNIEWAFHRGEGRADGLPNQAHRLVELARAVRQLPDRWPSTDADFADAKLGELLSLVGSGVGDNALVEHPEPGGWRDVARNDVYRCRPPLHELSSRSHGLVLLRWMLHRILPYPSFLMDELQVAARLRVDQLSPNGSASSDSAVLDSLAPYRYRGVLDEFLGARWWRAGVEDLVFQISAAGDFDSEAVPNWALDHGAERSRRWIDPVVTLGPDYVRRGVLAEAADCVRLAPDDWPLYADEAWATVSDANDPMLSAVVVVEDKGRLEDAAASRVEE